MCARAFWLIIFAMLVFLIASVTAFVYLEWWQAAIVLASTLLIMILGAKYLIRHLFQNIGEKLIQMTSAQALVLRNATVQVHSVSASDPPRELTGDDEFDDAEAKLEREKEVYGKKWYRIDFTIFPNPDIEESRNSWDPSGLTLVPMDAKVPTNLFPSDEMEQESATMHRIKVVNEEDEEEFNGPQRLLALVGLPPEWTEAQFRYYTEQFGRLRLPGPLSPPDPRRQSVR